MDQTLELYIETMLPWRLRALSIARLMINFVKQYPEGGEYRCIIKGELTELRGKSTAITNPSIEMGFIHSRALLEFLGLSITKTGSLIKANKQPDDINIESFGGLRTVTREQALSCFTEDRRPRRRRPPPETRVESVFVQTVKAANKRIAHSTEVVGPMDEELDSYFTCFDAIPKLFRRYFYEPLERQFPNIEISSWPATTDKESAPPQ